jgi:roadblock/LC7 domain-containing protein
VTTLAAPPRGRSLLGKTAAYVTARKRAKSARMAAVAAVVREHVVTMAALVSVDLGAFHWGPGVGWIVTGVSLLAADFAVRG